jgi:DNA invertase Pin-like site-specific DNA recombinase
MDAWWTQGGATSEAPPLPSAVAYYRHSAQDRQENSIPIQREQVQNWAQQNGIEIIQEFADHGKSGLSADHRDAFNDMLENWVAKRNDFQYVLVLDVSRWGRFQDIDLSATYSAECTKHGKQVVYTSLGLPKKNDPLHSVFVGFERFRAAQYSRELSEKVFKGCAKISEQGFRSGGNPPYGLHRLLLNEARQPVQILKPGERKSIQNQRVTLAPGDAKEMAIVRRIFEEFAGGGSHEQGIADKLNQDGISSPGGARWDVDKVRHVLTNELYIGTMIYNKTTQRLLSPSRPNPRDQWIRKTGAFEGVVSEKLYRQVQAIFAERQRRHSKEYLLERLREIYGRHGIVMPRLIKADAEAPSVYSYRKQFRGLDAAFQQMFPVVLGEVTKTVRARLLEAAHRVEDYADFMVVDDCFTVLVQPSVPVPWGYQSYWSFRPDRRPVVDITLGVPLSGAEEYDILGYLALPRLLIKEPSIRLFSPDDSRIELFGHDGLELIKELLK